MTFSGDVLGGCICGPDSWLRNVELFSVGWRCLPVFFGLSLLTGAASAQNAAPQDSEGEKDQVVLESPGTWPAELSATVRSLSDYGNITRYALKLGEPARISTPVGNVFWVKIDAAIDKAAVFGEPMYRFALYNSDDSQMLDYMYISGTNTATFIKQDIQFNIAALKS